MKVLNICFLSLLIVFALASCKSKKNNEATVPSENTTAEVTRNNARKQNTADTTAKAQVQDTTASANINQQNIAKQDSIKKVNIAKAKAEAKAKAIAEAKANEPKKFYVVVGSFKNANNALKIKKDLEKAGTISEILYGKEDFKRVCITYKNYKKAVKEQKKLTAIYKDLKVWVMDNKNNI